MNPQKANIEFVRNKIELVPLTDIVGRIAAEGALPYPPGVLCVVPVNVGVRQYNNISLHWKKALMFFLICTEIQGVYLQKDPDGRTRAYGYVLTEA